TGGEAVGFKNDGAKVQFPGVLELGLGGLQQAQGDLARGVYGGVASSPDFLGGLGAGGDVKAAGECGEGKLGEEGAAGERHLRIYGRGRGMLSGEWGMTEGGGLTAWERWQKDVW